MCADFFAEKLGMSLSRKIANFQQLCMHYRDLGQNMHTVLVEGKKNTQFVVQKILSVTLLRKLVADSESRL
jgi:hypothetical protein